MISLTDPRSNHFNISIFDLKDIHQEIYSDSFLSRISAGTKMFHLANMKILFGPDCRIFYPDKWFTIT